MKKFTLLIALLFASWQMSAQVQVGAGTTTSTNLPITSCYGYTYSQQIYLASEINATGNITSVSFYYASAPSSTAASDLWTVYLGHTAKTDFATTTDWESSTNLTQSYTGTVTFPAVGNWMTITLDTPFPYNGTDNLIVAVDENLTGYNCSASFNTSALGTNRAIYYYSDSTNPDPIAPPTASNRVSFVSNIIFGGIMQACPTPSNLAVATIGVNSADISWTNGNTETTWQYIVQPSGTGTPSDTTAGTVTTTNPTTLTGLLDSTTYEVFVRADCVANGYSSWLGPVTFTTLCSVFTTPYTEDFENAGTVPNCWAISGSDIWKFSNTGSGNHIGNNGVITGTTLSGNYFAWVDDSGSTSNDVTLLSPFINASGLTTPRLTFFELSNNEGNQNSVLTVSVWDGAAWNQVGVYNTNTVNGWEKKIIDLSTLTITGNIQLKFVVTEDPTGFYDDIAIDDVSVEETPNCLEPNTLLAANVTETAADLSWIETGTATEWSIEYGAVGFTLGTGTVVSGISTNPYTLSGLTPNTNYAFYVSSVCSVSDFSPYIGPFTFKTQCADVTNYIEDFDTYATGSTSPMPDCWSRLGTGFTYITTGSVSPMSPAKRLYMSASGTTPTQACAVLPGVSNLQANTHRLKFKAYATSANEFLSIGYLTDPSDITTFVQITEAFLPSTSSATAQEFIIMPTGIPTGVNHLAILNPGSPAGTTVAYLDDVIWEAIPACPEPTTLMSSNVTSSSADLSWTEMGSATTWNVEYGPVGYTQGTGGTSVSGVTTNPYTLSALSPSTVYDYYVQTDCGGTAGASVWVGPHTFTTLCTAFVAPYLENFDGLALASPYTALPLCWETQVGPDYWDVTNDVTNTGHTYLPNIGDHTTTTSNYMWIDASSNITANEMVSPLIDMSGLTSPYVGFWFASDNTNNTVNHTIALDVWDGNAWLNIATETGNFTGWVEVAAVVPTTVPSTTKFRIYAIANPVSTSSDYYFNDLGVDDFFVMETPTCIAPTSLTATNIAANSVDLGWTENGSATIWDIEWGTSGFTPTGTPTIVGTTTNPYSLSALVADTSYSFYVRADCGSTSGQSIWSGPFTFTTLISCPEPTVLTATNITSSSALLGWTEDGSATTWNVEYGPVGFTQGSGGTLVTGTTTNPYALTTLTPATVYDFYVQSDCGGTAGISNWAGPFTFTSQCITFNAPYAEGFENSGSIPTCWTMSGGENWQFSNTPGFNHIGDNGTINGTTTTGNYFAWVDDSSPDFSDVTLTSPLINASTLTTPRLTFYELSDNEGNTNATLTVEVWDGAVWNNMAVYNSNTVGGWEKKTLSLTSLTITGDIQVRFIYAGSTSGFYDDIAIDDVTIEESPTTPPVCAANIVATPNATCGNEATVISWDATALADGYYLTIGTTTGGTDVLNNVDIGAAPTYSHIGAPNTTYYYTVSPFNASGTASGCTEQSYMTIATGCYCPSVPTSNDNLGITNVQLGTTDFPNGDVTYFDHSATSISFAQGATSNVQITFATGYTYGTNIWIDFNDDYTFDASEIVFTGESTNANPTVFDASFVMPTAAVLGTHKMRIGTSDTGQATPDPCYSGSWGVTLDFSVTVTPLLSTNNFDNASFVAYPNPVKDVLNLSYSSEISSVKVINLLGQVVLSKKVGNNSTQIDMASLTAGTYIVTITIDDIVKTIKVIKQ
jgi:hypothetical protein